MIPYFAILKVRISTLFQYRLAALAGMFTQIFWGLIKIMILKAFYNHAPASQPISFTQAVTFIWLGQTFLSLLPWTLDKEVEAMIKTGNVSYELVRPLDLYFIWFFRSLAIRLVPTLMRSIPLFFVAGLFLDLSPPVSWLSFLIFLISLMLSSLVASAITTLVMISLFWTISGEGIQRLLPSVVLFFSGTIVPLPLFPDWMQPFLNLQPFRAIIDIPIRIYTGMISINETSYYLLFQLGWFLFFLFLGKWAIQLAMKRIVIQGG